MCGVCKFSDKTLKNSFITQNPHFVFVKPDGAFIAQPFSGFDIAPERFGFVLIKHLCVVKRQKLVALKNVS